MVRELTVSRRVQVAGHDVLVLGAGPIGLLAAQCAAAEGATRIILADINPYRLELAAGMEVISCPLVTLDISSCDLATEVKRLTGGAGVARLVEATGDPPIVNSCFRWQHNTVHVSYLSTPPPACCGRAAAWS